MTALSLEEKNTKATETAVKKAEKEETKEQVKEKSYIVSVDNNPSYCGIGAGGIQFANGKAVIKDPRMSSWFDEHDGYSVEVEER